MSSKKKYLTIGLLPELLLKLDEEAANERRSRGFIIEKILREYYKMPWERTSDTEKGET